MLRRILRRELSQDRSDDVPPCGYQPAGRQWWFQCWRSRLYRPV